jgi:hypothetical protein
MDTGCISVSYTSPQPVKIHGCTICFKMDVMWIILEDILPQQIMYLLSAYM